MAFPANPFEVGEIVEAALAAMNLVVSSPSPEVNCLRHFWHTVLSRRSTRIRSALVSSPSGTSAAHSRLGSQTICGRGTGHFLNSRFVTAVSLRAPCGIVDSPFRPVQPSQVLFHLRQCSGVHSCPAFVIADCPTAAPCCSPCTTPSSRIHREINRARQHRGQNDNGQPKQPLVNQNRLGTEFCASCAGGGYSCFKSSIKDI